MSFDDNNQLRPLIIDIGSDTFRLGWAGEDFPEVIAPSVYVDVEDYIFDSDVIEGLEEIIIKGEQIDKHIYGHDALYYQNILNIHEFKKEGNYNILFKYFYNYYQQLKIAPDNYFKQPIVILAPFFLSELEKSKLQHIFFKTLKFPSIMFLSESQAILSTLQKTTGVVINLGESQTYISSIFHGFSNIMARDAFPVNGKELTNYLLNLILSKLGSGKSFFIDKWIVKDIKEKASLCVLDSEGERRRVKEGLTIYNRTVSLPDGSNLEINSERFLIAEPIFDPKIIHIDYMGLGEAIASVIKSWDRENWEELVSNIILSGGTSLIPDLQKKLKMEIEKQFSEKIRDKVQIIAVSGREHMAWIGASILYSKEQLTKGWINNPNIKNEI